MTAAKSHQPDETDAPFQQSRGGQWFVSAKFLIGTVAALAGTGLGAGGHLIMSAPPPVAAAERTAITIEHDIMKNTLEIAAIKQTLSDIRADLTGLRNQGDSDRDIRARIVAYLESHKNE